MFKVINAEIKKMLSRPGVYVLALFLAIILVAGTVIYSPDNLTRTNITVSSETATTTERYNAFFNEGLKASIDANLSQSVGAMKQYSNPTIKKDLNDCLTNLHNKYISYKELLLNCATNNNLDSKELDVAQKAIVLELDNLYSIVELAKSNYSNYVFTLVTTNSNNTLFIETYQEITDWATTPIIEKSQIAAYLQKYQNDLEIELNNCISCFIYPTIKSDIVDEYTKTNADSKLDILYSRLDELTSQMDSKLLEVDNNNASEEMNLLINQYINKINDYCNLLKYKMINASLSKVKSADQLNLLYLSEMFNQYDVASLTVKYEYLFDNDKIEQNYAIPLTIGVSSNNETNAYDYSYFVLRVFSFVIILYAVTSASHSISGEYREGSLRYLAIRPINRRKIYMGKLIAILILSTILIIFSAVVSMCVGIGIYGIKSSTILTVFDGRFALELSSIEMLSLYVLSLIIELTIYLSIAMLFSSIFKMDVIPLTVVLLLFLINTLLPIFITNGNSWLTYYPFSHISIYSLFGSSLYANNNTFNLLLGYRIYTTTSIYVSILIILLTTIFVNFIGVKIFNKKEL